MGVGGFAVAPEHDADYRRGYLTGLIRGDELIGEYNYPNRNGRGGARQTHFRLALCDIEALDRAAEWLRSEGIETRRFSFHVANERHRGAEAIRTSARRNADLISELIEWPQQAARSWSTGFLAGIFDAEGSCSNGVLRISNTDPGIIQRTMESLRECRFDFVLERPVVRGKPIEVVRLQGGLKERLRFFHTVDPAITRKRDISGYCVKSGARLRITAIEPTGKAMRLYDITTGTEDFIANGVVSHNCYARPTHAYLGMSPASISKRGLSTSRTPPSCFARSCRAAAMNAATSCWAPTPIPTSRWSASWASPAPSSRCWLRLAIP